MARFPDGARVCFTGDSITHANHFVSHIVDYYRKHFPESGVEFYNCGISGGRLSTTLAVFNEDILPFAPTHVVLMIGINDSNRSYLNKESPEKYDKLLESFEIYKSNLQRFCELLKKHGVELILCTPTPYAEYLKCDSEVLRGGAALMLGYSEYLKSFAKERAYPLCDYHSYITRLFSASNEALYGADRIHPTKEGHFYIAKCFLEFQGLSLEDREIHSELEEWHKAVCSLRDTVATEHFILNDDFTTTDQERMAAILAFEKDPEDGPHREYFLSLCKAYHKNKKNQKDNLAFVKAFMKKKER